MKRLLVYFGITVCLLAAGMPAQSQTETNDSSRGNVFGEKPQLFGDRPDPFAKKVDPFGNEPQEEATAESQQPPGNPFEAMEANCRKAGQNVAFCKCQAKAMKEIEKEVKASYSYRKKPANQGKSAKLASEIQRKTQEAVDKCKQYL